MNTIKAVLLGESGVGKSAIFRRLETGTFIESTASTIGGAATRVIATSTSNRTIPIALWDTAGQERYKSVIPVYFEKANYVLLVYDLTSPGTFDRLPEWYKLCKEKVAESTQFIVIGNKSDLIQERVVDREDVASYARSINAIMHLETSAKTGEGLELLLEGIAEGSIKMHFWGMAVSEPIEITQAEPVTSACC
jgi:small GTP-binding protein